MISTTAKRNPLKTSVSLWCYPKGIVVHTCRLVVHLKDAGFQPFQHWLIRPHSLTQERHHVAIDTGDRIRGRHLFLALDPSLGPGKVQGLSMISCRQRFYSPEAFRVGTPKLAGRVQVQNRCKGDQQIPGCKRARGNSHTKMAEFLGIVIS